LGIPTNRRDAKFLTDPKTLKHYHNSEYDKKDIPWSTLFKVAKKIARLAGFH